MKWQTNWISYGLLGVGVLAIALSPGEISSSKFNSSATGRAQAQTYVQAPSQATTVTTTPQQPKRHKITVTLTSPDDLKIKQNDRISKGDIISDRTLERQRLEAKKQQLEIAIKQMSLPLSGVAELPPPNYEVEMAAVRKAKFELEQLEQSDELGFNFKDPELAAIFEPEKIKQQAELKEQRVLQAIAYQTAVARLDAAKSAYQQRQYQHSLEMSKHQTNLQRQQYQLASLVNQLQEVEGKLGDIVAVQSPYSGRVRRVKILGQNDRLITAEITLDIRNR